MLIYLVSKFNFDRNYRKAFHHHILVPKFRTFRIPFDKNVVAFFPRKTIFVVQSFQKMTFILINFSSQTQSSLLIEVPSCSSKFGTKALNVFNPLNPKFEFNLHLTKIPGTPSKQIFLGIQTPFVPERSVYSSNKYHNPLPSTDDKVFF